MPINKNEEEEFKLYLQALASAFGRKIDAAYFMAYTIGLRDLEMDNVKRAVERAIETCRFMPKVAELREMSGVVTTEQRCVLAWHSLSKAIVNFGRGQSVDFEDQAINATIRNLGGWANVCDTPESEFDSFFKARFEKTYKTYATVGVSEEMGSRLIGTHEHQNAGMKDWKELSGWSVKRIAVDQALLGQLPQLTIGRE